jgi:hypothetical protein
LSKLFVSHSSHNDDWAIALKDWLVREGWSGERDIFLDLDPERGIPAGQRWLRELEDAATRCEAVLFLVSDDWLASKMCNDEYQLASKLDKKLFALLIGDIALNRLPGGLTAQWQVVRLTGEPAERFVAIHPHTRQEAPVHISEAGLKSLKRGLEKAGIGIGEVKKLLIHQANGRMDQAILTALYDLYQATPPADVMPMTVSWLGNSSVATIPTLLDLLRKGRLEGHALCSGDIVVFASVGAGMHINAAVYRVP